MNHISASLDKARKELSKLCNKPSSFTMTVPAREDDSDITLGRALGYAKDMYETLLEIENANKYDSNESITNLINNLKNLKP
jgi:hypothetical protein